MLLELLNHPIYEHLSESAQNSHDKHMNNEFTMFKEEKENWENLEQNARVSERNDSNPFVDFSHHFHWFGFKL